MTWPTAPVITMRGDSNTRHYELGLFAAAYAVAGYPTAIAYAAMRSRQATVSQDTPVFP